MDHLRPTVFSPKSSKSIAILLTKSATIVFFSLLLPSFSLLFLFLLSFSFLIVILELLGPFDYFSWSLKWLQISLGWFSKNRVRFWPYSITNPLLIKLSSFGQKKLDIGHVLIFAFSSEVFPVHYNPILTGGLFLLHETKLSPDHQTQLSFPFRSSGV